MARARIVVACVIWLGMVTIGACGGDDSANPLSFVEADADSRDVAPDSTASDGTPSGADDVGAAEAAKADAPGDVDAADAASADGPGDAPGETSESAPTRPTRARGLGSASL